MSDRKLQWHPGFQAALQIELSGESADLKFYKEYNLGEKPLSVDTVVLKCESKHVVQKSIGRLFRKHNLIEYKSPADYLGINSFYKVQGYACLYQSLTEREQEHPPREITISYMVSRYPRKLFRHLKTYPGVKIRKVARGIFYIEGLLFATQIVLVHKLPPEDYVWLSRLRANLDVEKDIQLLVKAYQGKEHNPRYEAVMDLIIRANLKEGKEEMCQALRDLFADELLEREQQGIELGMKRGVEQGIRKGRDQLLQSKINKKRLKGKTPEVIAEELEEPLEIILAYLTQA